MALTVAQLVARLTADTSGFYKGMATANASMVRTGGIIKRVAAGAGIATLAMGFMAVKAAGNFQQSMNILQAVVGGTTQQMSALRKEAIALGADLKLPNTSAKDAADAMVELSKGGLSVQQVLKATRGTIQLSLAANEDLASSAQFVARSLKAFNLPGTQATKIANLMAAAANKSTAEFSDLQLGVQNASAQFTGAGYNIQTLTVALAELADKGLSGSLAGTALKVMMQRLESPTTKAAAAMKQMNVSVSDQAGRIRPLPVIIGQFQRAMEKMSPIARQQALNAIFGERANAGMMKLVQQGTEGWAKYTHAIVGNNAAQKMAEARTKGFNGALQGFQSAFETFLILVGTPLLGGLTRAVKAMSRFIEGLDTKKINSFIGGIFHIIGAFVSFVGSHPAVLAALTALVSGFMAFRVVLGVATMINNVRQAMILMNATFLSSPVGLIIAAVVGLAAGLYILYQRSATARRIMQDIWNFLRTSLGPTFVWLRGVVGQLATWIGQKWSQMRAYIHQHSTQILSDLRLIWSLIVGYIKAELAVITAVFHVVWPALKVYLQGVWNQIKIVVVTGMRVIRDIMNIVMGVLHGDWGRAWRGIKSLTKDLLTGVWETIKNMLVTSAKLSYTLAVSIGKAILNGIKDGITGLAGALKDSLVGSVKGGLDAAKSFLGIGSPSKVAAAQIGKPIADGIIEGYLLGIRDLPAKMSQSLQNALQRAQQVVSAQIAIFQDKFSRFTSYVDQAFDAISQAHLGPKGQLLQNLVTAHDQAALKDQLDQANQSVLDARAQLAAAEAGDYATAQDRTDAIAAAEKSLTDALAQQKEAQYQIRITALQKEADEEDKQYQARRNLQKQHLDDLLANFEAQMVKHPERAAYWQKRITETLNKYGVTYQAAGKAMGDAFADGLREAESGIEAQIKRIAHIIARYLRLHSPADAGPLSDLDKWWDPFSKVLTSSLDPALVRSAALGMAEAAFVPASGAAGMGLTPTLPGGAGTAGAQYIVPVTGNTFLTSERETLRALANALAVVAPNNDSRLQLKTS